jgi:hypothetical protein
MKYVEQGGVGGWIELEKSDEVRELLDIPEIRIPSESEVDIQEHLHRLPAGRDIFIPVVRLYPSIISTVSQLRNAGYLVTIGVFSTLEARDEAGVVRDWKTQASEHQSLDSFIGQIPDLQKLADLRARPVFAKVLFGNLLWDEFGEAFNKTRETLRSVPFIDNVLIPHIRVRYERDPRLRVQFCEMSTGEIIPKRIFAIEINWEKNDSLSIDLTYRRHLDSSEERRFGKSAIGATAQAIGRYFRKGDTSRFEQTGEILLCVPRYEYELCFAFPKIGSAKQTLQIGKVDTDPYVALFNEGRFKAFREFDLSKCDIVDVEKAAQELALAKDKPHWQRPGY